MSGIAAPAIRSSNGRSNGIPYMYRDVDHAASAAGIAVSFMPAMRTNGAILARVGHLGNNQGVLPTNLAW